MTHDLPRDIDAILLKLTKLVTEPYLSIVHETYVAGDIHEAIKTSTGNARNRLFVRLIDCNNKISDLSRSYNLYYDAERRNLTPVEQDRFGTYLSELWYELMT